ncbi:CPBP family intramembrane glutamic endopeptidase [Paenibacillus mendelii]|uniref:CPBP family intramembrane glutamic endopeptidase n=1 Tax=Paenibacillus mendelii TaxID=206163 RepID=A0ABV6JLU0_9BACL|nr:CPBP family intramembrane glutamic endopeptidase [Paenibacillus mendelii]MCQ6558686.1 CPBP family intramembrane metalloprotease [Paenibacillus mendelii]
MYLTDTQPNWKRYAWFAAVCAVIYLVVQIVPVTADAFFGTSSEQVIKKSAAEHAAAEFAQSQFNQVPENTHAVHQSNSLLYGYLSKQKRLSDYEKRYGAKFPTDTYQVSASMPDGSTMFIYVHMENGAVVAWNRKDGEKKPGSSFEKRVDAAVAFAVSQGFAKEAIQADKKPLTDGTVQLYISGQDIDEAKLRLSIRTEELSGGQTVITGYKPAFVVPAHYESYVNEQSKLASKLSLIGSILLSIVLFVLAIVYGALYRRHTSFFRGLTLTGIFLAFYLVNNINMTDGLIASFGEDPNASEFAVIAIALTCIVTVVMAAAVYFSLVAGDGLWRSMGRNLWPRMGEPGYGTHVWRSMWLGYLIALILLGAQTVILLVIEKASGAWSTTDVTQSPYNFAAPWLFPLLAWCAAISEEAVYRFFGIGILKRWIRNTFVASLIPSVIWALGHVTYPIFPATTRLFELTIIGLAFSYVFLRYGLITVIFAHAIFNSIMMAISLLFMGSAFNILMGIIYIVLPIPIAILIRYRHNRAPVREIKM